MELFLEFLKISLNWLSLPMTAVVAMIGYNFRSTLRRIENLEIEVIKIQLKMAKTEVNLENLTTQIDRIDGKLDKVLDRLSQR